MAGGRREAAEEVVSHQVDPVQQRHDARQVESACRLAIRGRDRQQVGTSIGLAERVEAVAHGLQHAGEVVAVGRTVADAGAGQGGVLPVDVDAVQPVLRHQTCGAVGERRTRGIAGRRFGEVAGAPTADRQQQLQVRIVGLQRSEAGERGCHRVAAQEDAVGVIDVREGEVDRIQLARVDGRQPRAVHHVTDHDGAMRRWCSVGGERGQRDQRQQAGGEAGHEDSTVVATRAGPPL